MSILRTFVTTTARRFGLEVHSYIPQRSESAQLVAIFRHLGIGLVLDVGANEGQYGRAIRDAGYTGRIVSFEPQTAAHANLQREATGDARWHVHPRCAVGGADGETQINISANSVSSSLLPMLGRHVETAPTSQYIRSESTPLVRLDSVIPAIARAGEPIFLKIDTQGYEGPVLDGAESILDQVAGIQLEMSLVPLYDGQALWEDLYGRLSRRGYKLWAMRQGLIDPASGRLLQMEGIFSRQMDS